MDVLYATAQATGTAIKRPESAEIVRADLQSGFLVVRYVTTQGRYPSRRALSGWPVNDASRPVSKTVPSRPKHRHHADNSARFKGSCWSLGWDGRSSSGAAVLGRTNALVRYACNAALQTMAQPDQDGLSDLHANEGAYGVQRGSLVDSLVLSDFGRLRHAPCGRRRRARPQLASGRGPSAGIAGIELPGSRDLRNASCSHRLSVRSGHLVWFRRPRSEAGKQHRQSETPIRAA